MTGVDQVKAYHAEVTRDGRFWHIRVPELDRSTQAVRELLDHGLSQREAGEVLGLSFQRINQLANS